MNSRITDVMNSKKSEFITSVMPAYFLKERVTVPINTWYIAPTDIWVTMTCNQNKQGYLRISSDRNNYIIAGWASSPATGTNSCSTYIRKGVYFYADTNATCFFDYVVGN